MDAQYIYTASVLDAKIIPSHSGVTEKSAAHLSNLGSFPFNTSLLGAAC